MQAKIIPYTFEDDVTPDPEMAGLVMLAIGPDVDNPVHVLDRIPTGAAAIICAALSAARQQGRQEGAEAAAQIAEERHIYWKHAKHDVSCDVTACEDIARQIRSLPLTKEPNHG